jgi:hypothetical protein
MRRWEEEKRRRGEEEKRRRGEEEKGHTLGTLNGSRSNSVKGSGNPGSVLGSSRSICSFNAISNNTVAIGSWGPKARAWWYRRIACRIFPWMWDNIASEDVAVAEVGSKEREVV